MVLELYLYLYICMFVFVSDGKRVVFVHQQGRRGLVVGGRRNVRGGLRVPGDFLQVGKIFLRGINLTNLSTL